MKNEALETVTAYIGLGSNLAEPVQQIKAARSKIAALSDIKELAFSSLYQSEPMGSSNQPDYINAVMAVTTTLPPLDLLKKLQAIEHAQGRIRTGERWGARTLDLDVLIYGDLLINEPYLTVPHPGIDQRPFVLYPLYEIAPLLEIPREGKISDLLQNCPFSGLKRLV